MAIVVPSALAQSADLAVFKAGPAQATPGSDVTYLITIRNDGPDPSLLASFNDPIPTGMTFVSVTQDSGPAFTCNAPPSGSGGNVNCNIASLAFGASADFTLVFNIPSNTPLGTAFVNTATSQAETPDENPENNSGVAGTATPPAALTDVSITKTAPTGARANDDVVFTISISNGGQTPAMDVSMSDTLPGDMTFVSLQTSGPAMACATPPVGSGGTITCTSPSFAASSTAVLTLTAHIPVTASAGTTYTNTATVTATADPNEENNTSVASVTVSDTDLSITKNGPANATAGTNISYTITVGNAGPDPAVDVAMGDTLPPGTTFVSLTHDSGPAAVCSSPQPGTNGAVSCGFTFFASGASTQYTLVVSVGNTSSITNTASVSSDAFDRDASNNSSSVTTTVSPVADVAVTKTGPATAGAGTNLTYTILVRNNGPSSASNVSLNDTLPAGTTFVSVTQANGPLFACNTPGPTLTCTIATLAPSASTEFTLVVNVSPATPNGTVLMNTATVATTTTDSTAGNNSSTATTTVSTGADLAIAKIGPGTASAGGNVTYTVTIANGGPSTALNVVLSDPLPANTTFVSVSQTSGPAFSCTTTAGNTTCTAASFASGASATFSFTFNISPAATGTVSNTATVSSASTDPAPANNTATETTAVASITDVAITKTTTTTIFTGGTNVTFTITVRNNGPAVVTGTTVTDVLPAGTTFVSATPSQGSCSGTTTVTCSLGTLGAGASATISLVVTLPATGPVSNTATVTISNTDTNPTNNSSTATIAIFGAMIPALSPLVLMILALTLAGVAFFTQRK